MARDLKTLPRSRRWPTMIAARSVETCARRAPPRDTARAAGCRIPQAERRPFRPMTSRSTGQRGPRRPATRAPPRPVCPPAIRCVTSATTRSGGWAAGGMGVVFEARQTSLNRAVALKMVKAGLLAGDDELRRFRNEAEAVAMLDHPGVVPVFEVGEHAGSGPYFSMKLVAGGSPGVAARSLTKGDPKAAATLAAGVAEAVARAHMRGILHRDLKPANILVDEEGQPHVTDFGLAKLVRSDVEMTASGAILGTPAYMAPEQAAGKRGGVTTATDVYGLGSILYALLTGKAPFGGDSVAETLDAVRHITPEPPRRLDARVPRDLETICLKCLEKDPRRRYATARDDGRGPPRLARFTADRGAARGGSGARVALVQAEAGGRGVGGGCRARDGRRHWGGDRGAR